MEMDDPPRYRTKEELEAFQRRVAFRETFLVEMPDSEKEIYRAFGGVIWLSGSCNHDDFQMPIKRQGLKAVVADLEHIVMFIETTFPGWPTNERAEERISRAALDGRSELRQAIDRFRTALGMKKR
jgi:hypothetical protein